MNTAYKEITVELKQKIAFAMMNSKSNAKLASSYGLGVSTLYKVVKGEQTKAAGKTYKKLVALANNQGKLNTSSSTEKKGGVPTPPKSPERVAVTDKPELAFPIQPDPQPARDELQKGMIQDLLTAYKIQKEVVESFKAKLDLTIEKLKSSEDTGLKNFESHSQALNERMDKLDETFETMEKRHKYVSSEVKDLKERVKKLEIRKNPAKF